MARAALTRTRVFALRLLMKKSTHLIVNGHQMKRYSLISDAAQLQQKVHYVEPLLLGLAQNRPDWDR